MVLFVFVVMMLNLGRAVVDQERKWLSPSVWMGPGLLGSSARRDDLRHQLSER